ncbi:hypothetical protein Tco_0822329 [Tanacetum coccineum]|uniref:Uncharacterized protein n=1 Tax=Tanacetum coccineum TaxID=301880 RepID=A0ABQ5AES8_9ASTR
MRPNMLLDCYYKAYSVVTTLINLRVAFHAINARRLPLAPLVYTLVRPSVIKTTCQLTIRLSRGFFEKQKLSDPTLLIGSKEIAGLLLMTMEPEIQQNLENLHANDMLKELKTLFAQQAEQELLQTTRDFHSCKQEETGKVMTLEEELSSVLSQVVEEKKNAASGVVVQLKRMQNVPYASVVGSIMYAVRCDLHWTTVKNILKYLRNTKDMFLVYEGDLKRELKVSCYTDAGYLTDADDLKSQTAEYVAAFDVLWKPYWAREIHYGLGVVPTIKKPINMYCDNTGEITIANESGITKGARHFCAKVHYLREVIVFGDI